MKRTFINTTSIDITKFGHQNEHVYMYLFAAYLSPYKNVKKKNETKKNDKYHVTYHIAHDNFKVFMEI